MNSTPKKDDIVTLDITEINNLGSGVGKLDDGMVVFVSGAVTGDTVKVKIIKAAKNFCVGKIEEIISPSPYREDGFCSAPNSCGGCVYRHVTREHELEMKKNYVEHSFIKAGLPDIKVNDVLTAGKRSGYRNKAQYPLTQTKNGVRAGFYAAKTHNIIPSETCSLSPDFFSEIVKVFCEFATEKKISVYDEKSRKGLLRHLYLRSAFGTGEIMVCAVINGDALSFSDELTALLTEKFPGIKSIQINVNKKNTNVVLGEKFDVIYGDPYITDLLCGKKFRISAGSFYQVNHDGAELLYETAARLADLSGGETLLDLYCGAGTIGLSMSDKVGRLVGIEIVPEAVERARENAALNGVTNAEFFCADASSAEELLAGAGKDFTPDVVILDPPRKGSTPELIRYIAKLGIKKVVYISCDPDTLARDCVTFRENGYTIGDVTPVDMFPATGHVETVCLLSKLNAKQHIEINLDMDELDLTDAEKKATYQEIKDYVLEHSGLKVSSLYIAQVKQKCGIIERENYNKPKSEDAKQPQCPPDKEKAIKEALTHFGMI